MSPGASAPITVRANPTRVTWAHFRAVTLIPGTKEEAQIAPEMSALTGLRPVRSPGGTYRLPSFTITVGLNREETIVLRTAKQTSELLQHEQGHFDVLLLTVRALARDLEAIEVSSIQDLAGEMDSARRVHRDRATALDETYDEQTDHSRNKPVQNRWNQAIADALKAPKATKLLDFEL